MWEYGEYGECSRSCDGGIKQRFPRIIQPARNRGRDCPPFVHNRVPQDKNVDSGHVSGLHCIHIHIHVKIAFHFLWQSGNGGQSIPPFCAGRLIIGLYSTVTGSAAPPILPILPILPYAIHYNIHTSVKIIKNEVRCRDDTMPKTVDTRKHCKVGLRACNNLPQPRKTKM